MSRQWGNMATPLMPMRQIVVLSLLLSIGTASAFGEPRFEVRCKLIGYDLVQATGKSQTENDLPPVTVESGSEGMTERTDKIKVATGSEGKFIPFLGPAMITHYRRDFVGVRMQIYVRQTEEAGKLTFLLRAEFVESDDKNDMAASRRRTISSLRGIAYVGKKKTSQIGVPGGGKATLEIMFLAR